MVRVVVYRSIGTVDRDSSRSTGAVDRRAQACMPAWASGPVDRVDRPSKELCSLEMTPVDRQRALLSVSVSISLDVFISFLTSLIPYKGSTLFHESGERLTAAWKICDESSNISQSTLQASKLFEIPRWMHLWMALTLSGSRWIPFDVTINPRNVPLDTPKKDFVGFIFSWWACIMSNIILKSRRWSSLLRLLTAMSST